MRGLFAVAAAAALLVLGIPDTAAAGGRRARVQPPAPPSRSTEDPPPAVPAAAQDEPAHEETPAPRPREWLADHQSADGGWSPQGFPGQCRFQDCCDGTGTWQGDAGTTGLAMLAFTGYGETHRTPRYGPVVLRAFRHLQAIQDADGCFGARLPERFVEDHAIAALALCELYGLTQSPLFKPCALRGLAFLLSQRNADGGWRSGDRSPESEVGATAWAVMAFRSARGAGLEVEDGLLEKAALVGRGRGHHRPRVLVLRDAGLPRRGGRDLEAVERAHEEGRRGYPGPGQGVLPLRLLEPRVRPRRGDGASRHDGVLHPQHGGLLSLRPGSRIEGPGPLARFPRARCALRPLPAPLQPLRRP